MTDFIKKDFRRGLKLSGTPHHVRFILKRLNSRRSYRALRVRGSHALIQLSLPHEIKAVEVPDKPVGTQDDLAGAFVFPFLDEPVPERLDGRDEAVVVRH